MALMSQEGSLFKASAQCHPSLQEVEDAGRVRIPHCVLPSTDEVPQMLFSSCDDLKSFLREMG